MDILLNGSKTYNQFANPPAATDDHNKAEDHGNRDTAENAGNNAPTDGEKCPSNAPQFHHAPRYHQKKTLGRPQKKPAHYPHIMITSWVVVWSNARK